MRSALSVLLILASGLAAADREPAHARFSQNDEMPRPEETAAAWAAQTPEGAVDAAPVIAGWYMWRGRADRAYKPFHQWEVALAGGTEAVRELRFRITVLGPDMKPLLGKQGVGHWVELGRLGSDERVDCSYKLNVSAPTAVRAEVRWDGGEASYLATDPTAMPGREGDAADEAKLLLLQPHFQYDKRRKAAAVRYFLRNDGGEDATGVVVTVIFRDKQGKEVHRVDHVPGEEGVVASGFAERITFVAKRVPAFYDIALKSTSNESKAGGLTLDGGAFSDRKEIQVANFELADGTLTADVRNGLDEPVSGLVVAFDLLGEGERVLETVEVSLGALAPGEDRPVSAKVGDIGPITGWGVGFSFGAGGGADRGSDAGDGDPGDGAGQVAGAQAPMDVDGVQLALRDVVAVGGAVKLDLTISNTRDGDLSGLTCELRIQDAAGSSVKVPVTVGDLAAGASFDASVVAEGVADVAGLQMTWSTGE